MNSTSHVVSVVDERASAGGKMASEYVLQSFTEELP
jgi:hypothetical protein